MTSLQRRNLSQDLKEAFTAGEKAAESVPDTGTCNMDSAAFFPNRRTVAIRKAIESAGGRSFKWLNGLVLVFQYPGQAAKRTRAAEAMSTHLRGLGYDAGVYYKMD